MTSKLIGIVALTIALVPGAVNAIGLGEITLQSRIGEALRAELPILGQDNNRPVTACFSLAPMPGSDLPVITAAKTRLLRRGHAYVLQIIGSKPINEPIFAIAVQAACGDDVMRDYVLIPEAPLTLATASPMADSLPAAPARPAKTTEWRARQGETIDDIADALAPRNLAERQRLIAAIQRANPDLTPDMPLEEGTSILIPKRKQGSPADKKANRGAAQSSPAGTAPGKSSPPRAKPRPDSVPDTKGGDQLRLGAAPEEALPNRQSSAEWQSQAVTEERLLKLETTLHLLTGEIEKMDRALELASQAIESQGKLAVAETLSSPRPSVAARISAPPAHAPPQANWLELLLSAALGAAISIGLAQYLGQRRRSSERAAIPGPHMAHPAAPPAHSSLPPPVEQPKPAAHSPSKQEAPKTAGVLDITEAMAAPPSAISRPVPPPPDEAPASSAEPALVDIATEDEYSVLELADIMLAFGRVRGAADTLAEYVEQNLPKSIQPWSMLLDLYRRGGMREEFEALAEKMHSRFNASIPAWSESPTPISGLKALEDYPHIVRRAAADWGSQACLDYLFGLISDTRTGQRNGFPLEVVEEIVLLMRVLEEGYGRKRAA